MRAFTMHLEEPTLERLRRRGAIRVGFQRHTPPFAYAAQADWPIGYSCELAREVVLALSARLDLPLRIEAVEVTSSTRTAMLLDGSIDIECGSTTITAERKRTVAFSRPIFRTAHRVALKAGHSFPGSDPLTITGISGSTSERALFDSGLTGYAPQFAGEASIGDAFRTFVEKAQIEGIVADEVILMGLLKQSQLNDVALADCRLGGDLYGFMMRPDDLAFHADVDCALSAILNGVNFARRFASWFERPLPGLGFSLDIAFETQLPHLIG